MNKCNHIWTYMGSAKQGKDGWFRTISVYWCEICGSIMHQSADRTVEHIRIPKHYEEIT